MRDLKFKAWSPSKKLWREDWVMDSYEKIIDLNEERYDDDLILCQYTGLKDNTKWEDLTEKERTDWTRRGNLPSVWNGKEIYEGDVMDFTHNNIGQVMWNTCCWIVQLKAGSLMQPKHYALRLESPHHGEVIGNIYEHPELLEKK